MNIIYFIELYYIMAKNTVNTLIDANPDFGTLSQTIRLLKGGEVISQSDYFHQDYTFNAVKMFDKSLDTFWHCNVKGGKNMNLANKENEPFKQEPYIRANEFTSVYQGGGSTGTKFSTAITGGESIAGSWAQITFPKVAYPGDMFIQIRKNNYNTNAQREMIKKVSFCCADADQDTPDEMKQWKLLGTYDFGTRYATKIEFAYKGVYGYEYFNIEINGKIFSSYVAKKAESVETIYIGGLDTLKIIFVNKKSFAQTGGAIPPAIMLTKFKINDKEMRDFIHHETRRSNRKPVNGVLRAAEGYDLVAAFPGDAEKPMFMPIKINSNEFKYQAQSSGTRTIRMIVQELYGGEKFNLASWSIMGTLGPIPRDTSNPGEPASSFLEKFTNGNVTHRGIIDNSIFNGIFTNSPEISGMSLTNEGFKNIKSMKTIDNKPYKKKVSPISQINKGVGKLSTQKLNKKYVKEGYSNNLVEGFADDGAVPDNVIDMEREVVRLLNKFNEQYAKYVHCNGLHLSDDKRSVKKSEDGEGKCWPKKDYYRLIQKIVVRMKVAKNVNSGTNQFQAFTFLGKREDDESGGTDAIAEPFSTGWVKDVTFSPASDTGNNGEPFDGVYTLTIENQIDDQTGELENSEIGGALHGLHEFSGQITGVRFSFGTSKLELNELQVTLYDQRSSSGEASYDLLNLKAANENGGDANPSLVLEAFKDIEDSATGAASNTSFDVAGNTLMFYRSGLDELKATTTKLGDTLDNMVLQANSLTNVKTLNEYNSDAQTLSNAIKQFKEIRYNMDMKLRELYYLDGTNSANAQLTYGGTMMSGMLWTALTASVLYYTFYEMD